MPDPGTTTDATDDHFDPDNRAWQRLSTALADHLDVITWQRSDGRPILVSLVDLHSGDIVSLAVIDSLEIRDPYALLAATTDFALTVHGPFDGANAAASHAPHLVGADPTVVGTCPTPLHHPDQPTLPDTAWVDMPDDLATHAHLAVGDATAPVVLLLLLDRGQGRHALVGPFPHHHAADTWHPQPATDLGVDRHVIALHPAQASDPPAWLRP